MRVGYVTGRIAIGGAINELHTYEDAIRQHGFTHIICLTRLCEHRLRKIEDVEILHFYIHDDGRVMPRRYWQCCVDYALDVLGDSKNKLLIHCAAGRNRSTSVCYAVLRVAGISARKAEKTILEKYARVISAKDKDFPRLDKIRYKEQVEGFLESYERPKYITF